MKCQSLHTSDVVFGVPASYKLRLWVNELVVLVGIFEIRTIALFSVACKYFPR